MDNILSFLGLALRGAHLVAGEEPVAAAARAKDVRLLLLASDAAEGTGRRARHLAEAGDCLLLSVPYRKAELGAALGRGGVALLGVTEIGFANALTQKLLARYGEPFADAAERMRRKAERAAERRSRRRSERTEGERPANASRTEKEAPQRSGRRTGKAAEPTEAHRVKSEKKPARRAGEIKRATPRFAGSRPVKKGKGSYRKGRS